MTLANAGFTHYLPVAPGLSLAINSLELVKLKAAIKDLVAVARKRHGERLMVSGVQHDVANALGFGEGWGALKAFLEGPFDDFRSANGLLGQADVLVVPYDCPFGLTYRTLSDGLFESGRPTPRHVFTGWNTDWWALLRLAATLDGLKVVHLSQSNLGLDADDVDLATIDRRTPPANYGIMGASGYLQYTDVYYFRNFIGDQLCRFESPGATADPVPLVYFFGDSDHTDERNRQAAAGRILSKVLAACDEGWLEVVPFNDCLAFLKAPNGNCAFVFKGMRDRPSPRESNGATTRDDEFENWLYHHYKGWYEADLHVAETAFYREGGTSADYPGERAVLQKYLEAEGRYEAKNKAAYRHEEFRVAVVEGRELSFTSLVTIRQFKTFMQWDRDYATARSRIAGIEPWEPANTGDPDFPAAVTWHDAVAYALWYRRTKNLPVRLPVEAEILALAGEMVPAAVAFSDLDSARKDRLYVFHSPDGTAFAGHPPYMSPEDFDRIELRYRAGDLPVTRAHSGLQVVQSAYFGEWLEPKGAAINTRFFCSQYDIMSLHQIRVAASRGHYASDSTGKYRGEKIGFRLVFDTKLPSRGR